MSVSSLSWSEERQQSLHEHLQGFFASDAWRVGPPHRPERQSTLDFSPLQSNALKLELKYAVWCKFQRKEWNIEGSAHHKNRECLRHIITWLNRVAKETQSVLEKSLEQWELSLRVNAQQILVYHQDRENEIVRWFRQMYKIVADAYDDRPEVEKDIWDLHKMGLEMNLADTTHRLNFTLISQPWLRDLVKAYMRYNLAVHSPGDGKSKMIAPPRFLPFSGTIPSSSRRCRTGPGAHGRIHWLPAGSAGE